MNYFDYLEDQQLLTAQLQIARFHHSCNSDSVQPLPQSSFSMINENTYSRQLDFKESFLITPLNFQD